MAPYCVGEKEDTSLPYTVEGGGRRRCPKYCRVGRWQPMYIQGRAGKLANYKVALEDNSLPSNPG
jgi:hypothetical protein